LGVEGTSRRKDSGTVNVAHVGDRSCGPPRGGWLTIAIPRGVVDAVATDSELGQVTDDRLHLVAEIVLPVEGFNQSAPSGGFFHG
jgi:hypothetical protein